MPGVETDVPAASEQARQERRVLSAPVGLAAQEPAPPPPSEPSRPVLIPRYHPRDAAEWQGMLVDIANPQWCERTDQCGMALSCHESQCLPCRGAQDCGQGEDCVLDHCVKADRVQCRRKVECKGPNETCILSGYSPGPRGNEELRAYCLNTMSGSEQTLAAWQGSHPEAKEAAAPAARPKNTEEDLLDRL